MYANIYISNGMLISIYHNLKAYFVSLGERFIKTKFAYTFIFLMGLIEAIIFPFPQEIFMVPMMALDKKKIFKIAGLSVLGSITGAIIAYFIGVYFFNSVGNFILQNLNLVESFNSFVNDIDNYGFLYVFIGGFTPIPFKIVTLTSGFLGINFFIFLVASVVSRSVRFFLIGYLIYRFGSIALESFEKRINLYSFILITLVILGILYITY